MAEPGKSDRKPRDRSAAVEAMAANLFVQLWLAERATKQPDGLAAVALKAAREFYRVCDTEG